MRISTAQIFQQNLSAMQNHQSAAVRAQAEVASGRKLLTPSDDPAGAKRLMDLRQALALNERHQRNADSAGARLAAEEVAIDGAINVCLLYTSPSPRD